jgi:hypothetical protein
MEKALTPSFLKSQVDLVTPHSAIRAGFLELVLEKNRRATPYVAQAKALRARAKQLPSARALLTAQDLEPAVLAASGISDKASKHLTAQDRIDAIDALVTNFLEPEGAEWVDELVFRYLLTRGDTLGGEMRNVIGALGNRKLARAIIAVLELSNRPFKWHHAKLKKWAVGDSQNAGIENDLNGLYWEVNGEPRTLLFNLSPPKFTKNIDLSLVKIDPSKLTNAKALRAALADPEIYLAFGELKSGFDPAGADEHWKTAQTALIRIRENYKPLTPATFFVGAAIVTGMADDIWKQLEDGTLDCAANLTDDFQLSSLCQWLTNF